MLKYKLITLLFSMKMMLCNCHYEKRESGFETGTRQYKASKTGQLPGSIPESSGLATDSARQTFWTHNDGGSKPELFKIDLSGKLLQTIPLKNLKNEDWEDLAQDPSGNLYIGDFGNNNNRRRDLKIYKLNPDNPAQADSISFRYEDQQDFPPAPENRNFDCEAFFWHADSLYLFSKNRGSKLVKMYTLPATPGQYVAKVRGTVKLKSMVTGAAINPGGTQFALLSYGKVFLFDITNPANLLQEPSVCIKLARSQAEAIAYTNGTDFAITNEQGRIYRVTKKRRK